MIMDGNKCIKVLFLGGARRVSLSERFMDAARKLKVKISFFSYELDETVAISSLAKIIIGFKWNDKDILNHLSKTIDELGINIVLPFVDPATLVAAGLRKMRKDIFVPVSDKSVCDTFFDKFKANEWFIKNRFPVPGNTKVFPLIAKPRRGSAAKQIVVIKNFRNLEFFKQNFKQKEYLIQEFIEGTEYTVDCYVSVSGQILAVVPRRRIEVIAGEATKSMTDKEPRIIKMTEGLLSKMNFRGAVTVQLIKEDRTGKLFILEVNPRFGGGVLTSIEAGADIPFMLLADYMGRSNKPVYNWENNLLMMRAYREVFKKCA